MHPDVSSTVGAAELSSSSVYSSVTGTDEAAGMSSGPFLVEKSRRNHTIPINSGAHTSTPHDRPHDSHNIVKN